MADLRWWHRWLPDSNQQPSMRLVLRVARQTSIVKTLYLTLRHGGWCVVSRGSQLRTSRGARLRIPRGAFLFMGFDHPNPVPSLVHLGSGAQLSITGTVHLHRGTRVLVTEGARLEIGGRTYINDNSTVTCTEYIRIGSGCAISWNTSILDGNGHGLTVAGKPRPRSVPVTVGDGVWIGTGAIILAGVTIGDGAIIGAGSVVTGPIPARTVAAGNPAKVIREDAAWQL